LLSSWPRNTIIITRARVYRRRGKYGPVKFRAGINSFWERDTLSFIISSNHVPFFEKTKNRNEANGVILFPYLALRAAFRSLKLKSTIARARARRFAKKVSLTVLCEVSSYSRRTKKYTHTLIWNTYLYYSANNDVYALRRYDLTGRLKTCS